MLLGALRVLRSVADGGSPENPLVQLAEASGQSQERVSTIQMSVPPTATGTSTKAKAVIVSAQHAAGDEEDSMSSAASSE